MTNYLLVSATFTTIEVSLGRLSTVQILQVLMRGADRSTVSVYDMDLTLATWF